MKTRLAALSTLAIAAPLVALATPAQAGREACDLPRQQQERRVQGRDRLRGHGLRLYMWSQDDG